MRDDRDCFDPDFAPSWATTHSRRLPPMPLRIRLTLAGIATCGIVAMIIAAFLVRG